MRFGGSATVITNAQNSTLLWLDRPCHIRFNWILLLRKPKCVGKEILENASQLGISETSRISRRHKFLMRWSSFSWCCYNAWIIIPKPPQRLVAMGRPDFLTALLTVFQSCYCLDGDTWQIVYIVTLPVQRKNSKLRLRKLFVTLTNILWESSSKHWKMCMLCGDKRRWIIRAP